MIKIVSDNSDVIFTDEQSIIKIDTDKFLFSWFYGCVQCGRKNPHSQGEEELSFQELLKRKGVHTELKKMLLTGIKFDSPD